jgi:hypothetical protein
MFGDRSRDRPPLLFSQQEGSDYQRSILHTLGVEIGRLPEERVLQTDPGELAKYFADKFAIHVPELRESDISAEEHERNVTVYDQFDQREFTVPGVAFDFEIPFSGDAIVFTLIPNTRDYNPPSAVVQGQLIKFTIKGRELSPDQLKSGLEEVLRGLRKYLGWHSQLWQGFPEQARSHALNVINERRNRLLKQKGTAAGLAGMGVKLKEKPGDARTFAAPAIRQRIEPKLPPMRPSEKPEPTLDRNQFEMILGLMRGAGRSIEQSSSRTRELDEEALRDMFLVPLNAHFGTASGEAFNFTGKTDIIVKHEGGNLFVAECKFWHGDVGFTATVDQLLGYLTWRDTKAAVVIFNRNVGFSAVLQKLDTLVKAHPGYVAGPKRLDETSFEVTLRLPHDADRHVTIAVLAFDLGPKATT